MWNKHWKSKLVSPLFCTCMAVSNVPTPSVTLYTSPNWYGHAFCAFSSSIVVLRPKSSLTESSVFNEVDSDVLFPKYSHRLVLANPCWGRALVAWSFGGGPKTGKTTGIPPRIAFEPSSTAFSDRNSCSSPFDVFQEVTVAP